MKGTRRATLHPQTHMTKTQIKKELASIIELLNEAQERLDNLSYDVEEERDGIEPYENRNELTEQQEERYNWLDEAFDTINDKANDLTDIISDLEYIE